MKPAGDFWEAEPEHQDYPEHYPSGYTCHYVRPNWGDRRSSIGKRVRETEAEATAFVVCQSVGLETGSAASDYIQLWNGDVQVLTKSLGYIRRAASQMLETLTDG